jgi:hypothetical protein
MKEVWSKSAPLSGERKTVPGVMKGETRMVGTRTPRRSKVKPLAPT